MSAFGGKADIANKFIRLSVIATARIRLMKWILGRIGHVIGIRSQEPASGHNPITPADPHQPDEIDSSRRVEVNFDAKRKELGVDDSLKDVPGVTTAMLVAFGEHGILRPRLTIRDGAHLRDRPSEPVPMSGFDP